MCIRDRARIELRQICRSGIVGVMLTMGRVSVVEAAELLGVHPQRIHQRIRSGSLPAERVGHRWVIDEADVAVLRHRREPGRPLSARSAWALVAVAAADEGSVKSLSPSN